jgi:hypothetical protein
MTAQDAMAGIQELCRYFKTPYKKGEVQRIWPELLHLHESAFIRTIGIIKKNLHFLPDIDYVLEQTTWWQQNMATAIEAKILRAQGTDPDAEGREAFELMKSFIAGQMEKREYIERLYAMAQKFHQPLYAEHAFRVENE